MEPTVSYGAWLPTTAAAYIEAKFAKFGGQNYPADKLEILVYSTAAATERSRLWPRGHSEIRAST